jgi:hypothetical protein
MMVIVNTNEQSALRHDGTASDSETVEKRLDIVPCPRDLLNTGIHGRKGRWASSPFEFTNMSINEPFDEKWKTQCRSRIKGCDGMIAFVSKNTAKAVGAIWEVKTSKEEGIPVIAVYTTTDDRPATPGLFNALSRSSLRIGI